MPPKTRNYAVYVQISTSILNENCPNQGKVTRGSYSLHLSSIRILEYESFSWEQIAWDKTDTALEGLSVWTLIATQFGRIDALHLLKKSKSPYSSYLLYTRVCCRSVIFHGNPSLFLSLSQFLAITPWCTNTRQVTFTITYFSSPTQFELVT